MTMARCYALAVVGERCDKDGPVPERARYCSHRSSLSIAATMSASDIERPDFLCTNFGPSLMPVTVPKKAK